MRLAVVGSICACLLAIGGSTVWIAASVSRVAGATESAELLAAASLQSTAATLREARQTLDLFPGESVAWRATVAGLAQPVATETIRAIRDTNTSLNGTKGVLGEIAAAAGETAKAAGEYAKLPARTGPALDNAAALAADLQASWDDSYWDLKAGLESATVAARSVAEASGTIERALPAVVATGQETNRQIAGIAGDVHTATSQFVRPKTTAGKVWEVVKLAVYGVSRAL